MAEETTKKALQQNRPLEDLLGCFTRQRRPWTASRHNDDSDVPSRAVRSPYLRAIRPAGGSGVGGRGPLGPCTPYPRVPPPVVTENFVRNLIASTLASCSSREWLAGVVPAAFKLCAGRTIWRAECGFPGISRCAGCAPWFISRRRRPCQRTIPPRHERCALPESSGTPSLPRHEPRCPGSRFRLPFSPRLATVPRMPRALPGRGGASAICKVRPEPHGCPSRVRQTWQRACLRRVAPYQDKRGTCFTETYSSCLIIL